MSFLLLKSLTNFLTSGALSTAITFLNPFFIRNLDSMRVPAPRSRALVLFTQKKKKLGLIVLFAFFLNVF